ncbi:unnamed protein product [Rotaria socialis]
MRNIIHARCREKRPVHRLYPAIIEKRRSRAWRMYRRLSNEKYKNYLTTDEAWFYLDSSQEPLIEYDIPRLFPGDMQKKMVLHQDSAPGHVTKYTSSYMKEHNINVIMPLDWLPKSSDAAAMDYSIWAIMKERDFDSIGQNKLPFVANQIKSIHLSNDDDTLQHPSLFFSYGFRFQQFTKLRSLTLYYIRSTDLINNIISDCSHLIDLNISSLETVTNLPKSMPNLSELIIETDGIYINGYRWKQIIISNLRKLRVFRLLMFYESDIEKTIHEEIDQLLESFQTKFWLDEHQCDMSKSTCPIDKKYSSSKYVNILILDYFLLKFASKFPLQFPNIHHLELSCPFDDVLWSVIPKFDRLVSIELVSIIHPDETDQSITDLHQLLDRAHYLHSITMDYLIISQLALMIDGVIPTNHSLFIEDEFVQWLKNRLPSYCLVIRDENELSAIQLWFR